MDFEQLLLMLCIGSVVFLVVIGLIALVAFRWFLRALNRYAAPDTDMLQRQFDALRADHPDSTPQQLVRRIINRYAFRQGMVGALTSIGGLIVLPFGLTIDLAYFARSTASLSYFIAQVYGIQQQSRTLNLAQLLALRGREVTPENLLLWQEQFAAVARGQLTRAILRRSFAKVIPGLGALIGFGVNWASAQLFGRIANEYYSGSVSRLIDRG
jgi:hypothetical protein